MVIGLTCFNGIIAHISSGEESLTDFVYVRVRVCAVQAMSLPLEPKHTESQHGRDAPSAPPNYDWWSFHPFWRHRGTRRL